MNSDAIYDTLFSRRRVNSLTNLSTDYKRNYWHLEECRYRLCDVGFYQNRIVKTLKFNGLQKYRDQLTTTTRGQRLRKGPQTRTIIKHLGFNYSLCFTCTSVFQLLMGHLIKIAHRKR